VDDSYIHRVLENFSKHFLGSGSYFLWIHIPPRFLHKGHLLKQQSSSYILRMSLTRIAKIVVSKAWNKVIQI